MYLFQRLHCVGLGLDYLVLGLSEVSTRAHQGVIGSLGGLEVGLGGLEGLQGALRGAVGGARSLGFDDMAAVAVVPLSVTSSGMM